MQQVGCVSKNIVVSFLKHVIQSLAKKISLKCFEPSWLCIGAWGGQNSKLNHVHLWSLSAKLTLGEFGSPSALENVVARDYMKGN